MALDLNRIHSVHLGESCILVNKRPFGAEVFEDLDIEVPYYFRERLQEQETFDRPEGFANLNALLPKDMQAKAQALGAEVYAINNIDGRLVCFDKDGEQIDFDAVGQKEQPKEGEPAVTDADVDLFIKTLMAEINRNKKVSDTIQATFGENAYMAVSLSVSMQESCSEDGLLEEGILNAAATAIDKVKNAVKGDVAKAKNTINGTVPTVEEADREIYFTITAKVNGGDPIRKGKATEYQKAFSAVQRSIVDQYSGKKFRLKDGSTITFDLLPAELASNLEKCSMQFKADLTKTPVQTTEQTTETPAPEKQGQSIEKPAEQTNEQQPVQPIEKTEPAVQQTPKGDDRFTKAAQKAYLKRQKAETKYINAATKAMKKSGETKDKNKILKNLVPTGYND